MAQAQLSPQLAQQALDMVAACGGSMTVAALEMGIPRPTLQNRVRRAEALGLAAGGAVRKPFERDALPGEVTPTPELIERRIAQFRRKSTAAKARELIDVRIRDKGPIGIVHFGDPHVDDDGTDIAMIREHLEIVNSTPGMFAANVGDLQNNWVGRLSHLWSQQSVSAAEAWALTEWLIKSADWLYLIRGNHDVWSGEGDPVKWMMHGSTGVSEAWGVRLNLNFPNGRAVRINARHDFSGHSMWNTVHGPAKAVQMGWRDHVLTCGHKHVAGYQVLMDPATGLISHAIRCGSYKMLDRYAAEKGLPNQNIFPAAVTIIDPRHEDHDTRLVTTMFDVRRGAEFLTYLRKDAK